ncbi:MAG: DUF6580 family putative transport protein [Candidatus Kerfeldbacteria bacterium]
MNKQFTVLKVVSAVVLIAFGAGGRYLLKDVPNIETITVVALLAGSLLGGVWTIIVGLVVVAITDIFIGNTSIMLYTWSAWAAVGLFGWAVRKRGKTPLRHSFELTGMGLFANVFFYAWTNFGVWQMGWMYPKTLDGLVMSYVAGLPFLKYQMIGTLIIVPSVSFIALHAWKRAPQWLARRNEQVQAGGDLNCASYGKDR